MKPTLIVIGAGPMGLEAGLAALERGFDVTVLERARIGESLRRWGGTRFFSPFGMNVSPRIAAILGASAPRVEALLTGPEMVERVLEPVARSPRLDGRVRTRHRVAAVGRAGLTRRDMPGHPMRAERRFRLLVETPAGEETFEADAVLDASGVYDRPAFFGTGGVPARGERGLNGRAIRTLGTLEERLADLAGKDVLLVGHGHSAATALEWLATLEPRPRVMWATRSANRRPCVEFANDPLPERERIAGRANELAAEPPSFLTLERRATVEAVEERGGRYAVTLSGGRGGLFDAVLAFTGYRPDLSFLSELSLEISPVSEGTARLERALLGVSDCLTPPSVRPADLASGEPGFFLVGAKSFGRLPTFLLKTGLSHLDSVFDVLTARRV
jgi:thioredoxin reductase